MAYDWEKLMRAVPHSELNKIKMITAEDGYAKGYIDAETLHENQYKGLHGGALFTLADTVSGIGVLSTGYFGTTVDATISYLKAAPSNQRIYCEAVPVKKGKTLFFFDVKMYGEDETLYAKASFTYFVLDKKFEGFEKE